MTWVHVFRDPRPFRYIVWFESNAPNKNRKIQQINSSLHLITFCKSLKKKNFKLIKFKFKFIEYNIKIYRTIKIRKAYTIRHYVISIEILVSFTLCTSGLVCIKSNQTITYLNTDTVVCVCLKSYFLRPMETLLLSFSLVNYLRSNYDNVIFWVHARKSIPFHNTGFGQNFSA